jgi:hypothetical protein
MANLRVALLRWWAIAWILGFFVLIGSVLYEKMKVTDADRRMAETRADIEAREARAKARSAEEANK